MDGAHESFTVLPPLSPRVPAVPPPPLTPADSRVAPRTVAHKEATAFVILGEIAIPTADDKKGPPAGRVSPFRGSGFRAPSPPSPTSKIPVLNGKSAPASPARNINNKTNNNTVNNGKISTKNKVKTQIQGKSAPTSPKKITATTRRKIDSPSRVPVSIKSQSNVDLPTLKEPNNNKRLTTKTLPRTPRRAPQNGTTKAPAPVQRRLAPDGKPAPAVRSRLNNGPVSTEVKAGSVVGPKNAAPKAAVRRTLTKTENVATLMRNSKKSKTNSNVNNNNGTNNNGTNNNGNNNSNNVNEDDARVETKEEEMNRKNFESTMENEANNESSADTNIVSQVVTSVTETVPEMHTLNIEVKNDDHADDNDKPATVVELITADEELGRLMTTPKVTVSNGKLNGSVAADDVVTAKRKLDISKIRNGMTVLRAVKASSTASTDGVKPADADGSVVEETEEVRGPAEVEVDAGNHTVTFRSPEIHPVSPRAPPKSFNRPRGNFRDRFRDAICGCCGRGRLQSGKIGILGADNDRVNVITDSGKKREAESEEPPQKWYSRLCRRKKKEAQPPRLAKPMKPQGKSFLSKMNCCKKGPTVRKPQMVQNGTSIWRKIFCLDAALCAKCCMKKRAPAAPPPGASRLEMKRSSSVPAPPKPTGLPKLDLALVEHGSVMKGAIPVLPICLAWMCLILNILIPGTGTIISGFLCMCFGKPRFSVNDSAVARLGSLCVNMIVGISQIFTIIFCLVGWGWSIWWGVIMIKVARKHRRIKLAEKATAEAGGGAAAPATPNPDKDLEKGGEP